MTKEKYSQSIENLTLNNSCGNNHSFKIGLVQKNN